jgi:predicted ATPase
VEHLALTTPISSPITVGREHELAALDALRARARAGVGGAARVVGEAALVGRLKTLIAARLVIEDAPDQFAFRHVLTRAALYADLPGRERRALHAPVAAALEASLTSAAPSSPGVGHRSGRPLVRGGLVGAGRALWLACS